MGPWTYDLGFSWVTAISAATPYDPWTIRSSWLRSGSPRRQIGLSFAGTRLGYRGMVLDRIGQGGEAIDPPEFFFHSFQSQDVAHLGTSFHNPESYPTLLQLSVQV